MLFIKEKRDQSEPNLTSITKAHEKVRKERGESNSQINNRFLHFLHNFIHFFKNFQVSSFYRKKLRSLYQTTISESDEEIKLFI